MSRVVPCVHLLSEKMCCAPLDPLSFPCLLQQICSMDRKKENPKVTEYPGSLGGCRELRLSDWFALREFDLWAPSGES